MIKFGGLQRTFYETIFICRCLHVTENTSFWNNILIVWQFLYRTCLNLYSVIIHNNLHTEKISLQEIIHDISVGFRTRRSRTNTKPVKKSMYQDAKTFVKYLRSFTGIHWNINRFRSFFYPTVISVVFIVNITADV